MRNTINTLKEQKKRGEKISVVAAYDATLARLIANAGIEAILVGDSLGMVLQGQDSTLPVTIDDIAYHTEAVSRGIAQTDNKPLIIADMPFASYSSVDSAVSNAAALMRAGAHKVKLEGGSWLSETVEQLCRNGIPVCAHLGLTPQSVNVLGGYSVQGKTDDQQQRLLDDTTALESAGASMIVYECIPASLAQRATNQTNMVTIGIGAGADTDGQVLVGMDLLGTAARPARFVKNFLADANKPDIAEAFKAYNQAVKSGEFPASEHQYR